MMRSWIRSYAREIIVASVVISVITHAGIIAWWIVATLPTAGVAENSIANHIFFIPPPDRVRGQAGTREAIQYVQLDHATLGAGTGEGARMMGEARPTSLDQSAGRANDSKDTVTSDKTPPVAGQDSVYSVLEVDTAVVRSTRSAAPAYPLKLLEAHVQGFVNAQYIVDTTGFADTASFNVLKATNPEFIVAVKEALPYMRFSPAKIGPTKVKQLVQQQFSFKINDSTLAAPKKKP